MNIESIVRHGSRVTAILAVTIAIATITLLGLGYRATREWRRSSERLVERDTEEAANLLLTALKRDMQGAQARVLANRDWSELSIVSLTDTSEHVATAFARYPYPESFFTWNAADSTVVFFNRANRYPRWIAPDEKLHLTPVVVDVNPPGAERLRAEVESHAASRVQYLALNMTLAEVPYQLVARLTYADPLRERLVSIIGFTVNLGSMREVYFSEIMSQLDPIVNRGSPLDITIVDDAGRAVWGRPGSSLSDHVRVLPILFLDRAANVVAVAPDRVAIWTIRVGRARNSSLASATLGPTEMLLLAGAAVLGLGIALILVVRTVRSGVMLAGMRSDFVSSVTHELKMPLANIQAVAATLGSRPVAPDGVRTYADYLMHEARRLRRLIDNLLAYARVSDVTNVYAFEPIAPGELVDDALQGIRHRLAQEQFVVEVDVPVELPFIRVDRASMLLALDNLLDNAIRYSSHRRRLTVTGRHEDSIVAIQIQDQGAGIPASELTAVRQKFVRGRNMRAPGSGLGLAIVSRIVADHSGMFELESELESGTTARIRLPIFED